MGGGGPSAPPTPPWKERVRWIDSDYTSWDQGQSWAKDPNYHFWYGGTNYYITNYDDIEDQSKWRIDTVDEGFHQSEAGYQAYLEQQQAEAAAREAHEAQMRAYAMQEDYMRQMKEAMARAEAQRTAYYAKLAKQQAEAEAAAKAKEERRRRLASLGRSNLNLTGGRGADMEAAKVLKRKLGGSSKSGASARA